MAAHILHFYANNSARGVDAEIKRLVPPGAQGLPLDACLCFLDPIFAYFDHTVRVGGVFADEVDVRGLQAAGWKLVKSLEGSYCTKTGVTALIPEDAPRSPLPRALS